VSKVSDRSAFEQVYEITRRIPAGNVLTYGDISVRMNRRLSAAAVGWALGALGSKKDSAYNSENVPWHRVVNSKGTVSTIHESSSLDAGGKPLKLQQLLLEKEGVVFGDDNTIDLARYRCTE
jgi:methylated-DNA-protein-cysteine methyltransferase related protein